MRRFRLEVAAWAVTGCAAHWIWVHGFDAWSTLVAVALLGIHAPRIVKRLDRPPE